MLKSLTIENFAIIDEVSIDFSEGMTVLSGETGAGKSILIDALGLLCGGRGSTDFIRSGKDRFVIEGLFDFEAPPEDLIDLLATFGIEFPEAQDGLIIRREINQRGSNLIRINGQLATVSLLRQVGNFLADIHGQNEHQSLLNRAEHLNMLDEYGDQNFRSKLEEYQHQYKKYSELRSKLIDIENNELEQRQQLDFLKFQSQEIENANLSENEEQELLTISKQLQNSQRINQHLQQVNYLFTEMEQNVFTSLHQGIELLKEIADYHKDYPEIIDNLENSYYELEGLAHQIALTDPGVDEGNDSINEIEARLNELEQLKQKYRKDVAEIIVYHETINQLIYEIEHRDQIMETMAEDLEISYQKTYQLATELHELRKGNAQQLIKAIEQELKDLYMADSTFAIEFATPQTDKSLEKIIDREIIYLTKQGFDEVVYLTDEGYDETEFFASTNIGEKLKPLVNVASGGELSRFMLALKAVFSRNQSTKIMVFDEIDTGVSGRVAHAIAEKILEISDNHQVLCITHLPQVAAIADRQLLISKQVKDQRTQSVVNTLSEQERTKHIARMIAGENISDTSKQMAQEMLMTMQQKGKNDE